MTKRKRGRANPTASGTTDRQIPTLDDTDASSQHVKNVTELPPLPPPRKKNNKSQKKHLRKVQATSTYGEEISSKSIIEKRPMKKKKINTPNLSHGINETKTLTTNRLDLSSSNGTRHISALQQTFLSRLAGSRFRELNEELYTTNSSEAFERFQSNPVLFSQYHEGFRTQVKSWPVNPVDVVYRWILSVNRNRGSKKDTKRKSQLVVADFGCGDATLAQKLLKIKQDEEKKTLNNKKDKKNEAASLNCPFRVHSFDLVANGNEYITPCDMANVPLKDGTVDIAVFVLALMGTNIADFIREAHRVLRSDGILKIAEVRSRFESASTSEGGTGKTNGKHSDKKTNDSLLNEFLSVMLKLGFKCTQKDRNNKMFILLEFEKTGRKPSKDANFTAKPCIYKRR